MYKFKKGDFVRCIEIDLNEDLTVGAIYRVYNMFDKIFVCLSKYNNNFCDNNFGFYTRRFKKIDLTDKERFEYIKYKLGVRDECQKK